MKFPGELIDLSNKIVNLSPWNIRAIILCGSFAKKEFSILDDEEGNEVLSDYDLEVLVRIYDPFLMKKINDVIKEFSIKVTVGIIPIFLLKHLKMIQIFEMKKSGIIIFGEREILKKIQMEDSSDIPIWEGIRYLLNANMELLESVNYNSLKEKMSISQFRNMVYSCAKAYLTCCKALLVLLGEFRINIFESVSSFEKVFAKRFEKLNKKLPFLVEKVKFALNFKLNPKLNQIPRSADIWFETRDHLLTTLEYCLSEYLRRPNESLFSLIETLLKMSPKPLQNLVFMVNSFLLKKSFPNILIIFKIPILLAQISGIYLTSSIDEKGILNQTLLEKVIETMKKVYPMNATPGQDKWDSVRKNILDLWKIAPDYVVTK